MQLQQLGRQDYGIEERTLLSPERLTSLPVLFAWLCGSLSPQLDDLHLQYIQYGTASHQFQRRFLQLGNGACRISNLDILAKGGNLDKVDLTVGDIAGGKVGVIPSDATASNFGKIDDTVEREDIARGVINMVSQTVGVIAIFASRACELEEIILTGKVISLKEVQRTMRSIEPLFDTRFIIPEKGEYATAFGAAVAILDGE